MKIRFYHWWVYRLYSYMWTPIFKRNPQMVRGMIDYMEGWLDQQEREIKEKMKLRIVK